MTHATTDHVYTSEQTVRSYEIGPDQRVKTRPLLHYLQEAAVENSRRRGDSFREQIARGACWVFSRIHLRMDRYPCWGDRIRIHTWSADVGRLAAVRDFRIEDDAGVCGAATTHWLYMNVAKRRPVRIPEELKRTYGEHSVREIDDPFRALPELGEAQHSQHVRVRRGDLDSLNHTNYAAAAELCLESLPTSQVEGMQIARLEIAFRRELLYGEKLLAEAARVTEDGEATFLHRLTRAEEGDLLVQGRTEWRYF